MPTSFTEAAADGEVVLSEANGTRSRETITLLTGVSYRAGEVLGKITSGGKYNQADQGASDGTETAVAVLIYAVDATGGDKPGDILARDAEVKASMLQYKSGQSGGNQTTSRTELAAVGIISR